VKTVSRVHAHRHALPAAGRVAIALAACLGILAPARAAPTDPRQRPSNVIVILVDDMGWRDVGFMGNTFVETPHLDRLAAGGLVFTQAYASAPNCAPTRACLMSGLYTPRHGIYTVVDPRQSPGSPWQKLQAAHSNSDLATEVVTLPESLKKRGYATAFFGMWNLGRGRTGPTTPGGQGFDRVVFPETVGFGKDAYFDDGGHYLGDRLTDEVLGFVEQHRDGPFFVYLADHAVHAPFDPKPDLLEKYRRKAEARGDRRDDPAYAATIEAVDQSVGRIVDALHKLDLADDTLVIFMSDNGGTQRYTAPLRGGKGELYEGGIRVPLVASLPSLVKPGRSTDVPVATIDLYPTLLELAGAGALADQTLDGTSLVPLFRGGASLPQRQLFWHFPCYVGRATPSSAVRAGPFKLIEFFEDGGRRELYDLRTDPGEQRDLAAGMPEKAAELTDRLHAWQQRTTAAIPSAANPAYDPGVQRPRGGGNRAGDGQGGGRKGGRGPQERTP
jgi:arylsulfatase A-like enzyme